MFFLNARYSLLSNYLHKQRNSERKLEVVSKTSLANKNKSFSDLNNDSFESLLESVFSDRQIISFEEVEKLYELLPYLSEKQFDIIWELLENVEVNSNLRVALMRRAIMALSSEGKWEKANEIASRYPSGKLRGELLEGIYEGSNKPILELLTFQRKLESSRDASKAIYGISNKIRSLNFLSEVEIESFDEKSQLELTALIDGLHGFVLDGVGISPDKFSKVLDALEKFKKNENGEMSTSEKFLLRMFSQDPEFLYASVENQPFAMSPEFKNAFINKLIDKDPVETISAFVNDTSAFSLESLEIAMSTWIKKDSEGAAEWFESKGRNLSANELQYVAAAYAKEAASQGNVILAREWGSLIQNEKISKRINTFINSNTPLQN